MAQGNIGSVSLRQKVGQSTVRRAPPCWERSADWSARNEEKKHYVTLQTPELHQNCLCSYTNRSENKDLDHAASQNKQRSFSKCLSLSYTHFPFTEGGREGGAGAGGGEREEGKSISKPCYLKKVKPVNLLKYIQFAQQLKN